MKKATRNSRTPFFLRPVPLHTPPAPPRKASLSRPILPRSPPRRVPYASSTASVVVRKHTDPTEIEPLALTLASAFEDDPLVSYFYGHDVKDRHRRSMIFNRTVLRAELSRPSGESVIHVSEDGGCVAVWHYEGHWELSGMYLLRFLMGFIRCFGWRAFSLASAMKAVEDAHPKEPHMHLFMIGTHQHNRGKGLGSIVISKMLAECDRERLPAYLESSNERNLSFYRRHGFELLSKVPGLAQDCPAVFGMWREPQPVRER
ncbi:unnamed protein product [Agarophyton chilense]|eukprot:gb/GEZJ01005096.1/.p1 GENE.gb/GEZJ01005096.1/~~gb/GEZJ01005096.1/.p1  ORF type:complete len:293 (-),score=25.54 gb/GEZJ01005096.1/:705-1484(-)